MKNTKRIFSILLTLCLILGTVCTPAFATTFTDAHGNVIELDDTLEAYSSVVLSGADNAARRGETNLGDLWTDALRWFVTSGKINEYFDEDDVTAGNNSVAVDADHVVALWNGGNLRDDIAVGKFGAVELANVLPYPNKVAVVYMTGAQLVEALEAASQGLPYGDATADACASFMQVSGLKYTVNISETYDAGEAYGSHWYKANSIKRVTVTEVNGKAFDASATYAVITSNANFNGMDSSYMFKAAVAENEKSTITTAVVRDVVWMYIDEVLENIVGEAYAEPQNRISMVFTDAHGNVVELDGSQEAYSTVVLSGADNAARKAETNLGDLWTDAMRWFVTSGKISEYFDEDDVTAGNNSIAVEAENVVALWNGGNLRADIAVGNFGAVALAEVLPYPNKIAVVYMTGAQLLEALEAASQALPCVDATADACASFMQVSGLKYTVNISKTYDAGETYGSNWFKANSIKRVTITEINGKAFDAAATYAVITSNANFNGMDSSYMFKAAAAENEKSTITNAVVREVVWMYIDEVLGNVVGSDYTKAQGRIQLVGFADVVEGKYYAEAVTWALDKQITNGTSDAAAYPTFSPNETCTNAQILTFMWRAAGSPTAEIENPFTNLDDTKYYYQAALWAAEKGMISGTTFDASAPCTRAMTVTYLWKLAGSPETKVDNKFADVAADASYAQAVAWAVENGVTNGTGDTTFTPDATCTRGQIVTFLMRYFNK